MNEMIEMIKINCGLAAAVITVLGVFIEISPIKINPLTALFRWAGNALNGNTSKQLNSMTRQLDDISDRIDKIEINDMRSTLLDFANSCMNKRSHTKEEFEHMIDLHTQYEDTISKKSMRNGRVDLAFKYISDLYTECLNDNSFLDG